MLALVELCKTNYILDRPDLGCSMLIAACQEQGIKTTLIKSQTRYLKDIFVNDNRDLWDLIEGLNSQDLKNLKIENYKKYIQEKGLEEFQNELRGLYEYVIADKSVRHYLDAETIERFFNHYKIFITVSAYYLTKLNYNNLKIVNRYIHEIVKDNPNYICVSLQSVFEPLSLAVRKRIKELTAIPIIVGGSMTPFMDLKKLKDTFKDGYFDYLVIGPGEYALPHLIDMLENKKE